MVVRDLDIAAVKAGLADGTILVVDVREPHEFAAGRIPGSVSLPLSQFDPSAIPDRRASRSCSPARPASARCARSNSPNPPGWPIDSHYVGGFKDWVMQGEPIER